MLPNMPVTETPVESVRGIFDVKFFGAWHGSAIFGRRLVAQGTPAAIYNVGSENSLFHGVPMGAAYVATKHGLAGLTKTVALELAETGITCNAVSPGYVLTPLVAEQIPDTMKARGLSEEEVTRDVLLAAQPTKQFITVDQVGAMAVYLCSDAAAQITGANIPIDGGWTAQ